ncbi:MAG: SpoVA/SpoVAEb family sporulation membrane protein [Christensenellaceae bacterium]|jgi:stage V sporulation protein AC|nr:SpoVA/SpoVAEb family sporulation membrane protein [Christensenellaceae bacterium]
MNPKSPMFPSLLWAFLVGGLICVLGEEFFMLYKFLLEGILVQGEPLYDDKVFGALSSSTLVFLASILTGVGIFDKIGKVAGAGTIVPITGFSNSITSEAIEFKKEGLIYGTCANMFKIAGPVIVVGAAISMLLGVIYWAIGLF